MTDGLPLASHAGHPLLDLFASRPAETAANIKPEDTALVSAARENRAAFAALYRRYANSVYRYMLAYVGHVQDAQDLTEQTFLAGLEGIRSFEGRGQFAAWLFSIAHRKVMDYYRHERSHIPLDSLVETPHPGRQPDQIIEEQLDFEQLAQAIGALAPDRAEAIRLRIFAELSVSDIGEMMGRSESAVRMLLSRAVNDLRRKFNAGSTSDATR